MAQLMWIFDNKHTQQIKLGINAALIVVLLLLLSGSAWHWRSTESDSSALQSANTLSAVRSQTLFWNWYKTGAESISVPTQDDLDDARVRAELIGVIITQGFSAATLIVEGRPEALFHVGDELKSGVKVISIDAFRLVVEERGVRAQINMKKSDLIISSQDSGEMMEGTQGFSIPNMFSAVPVSGENFDAGFKIKSLSAEIQSLTDMQEGDVLVEIGSYSIEELMSDPTLWMEYSANTAVPVVLLRNGQQVLLNVNAMSLATKALPNVARDLLP